MSFKAVLVLLLAALILGRGLWMLAVTPDPPATASVATRKSRQMIAIGFVILGVFFVALQTSLLLSE